MKGIKGGVSTIRRRSFMVLAVPAFLLALPWVIKACAFVGFWIVDGVTLYIEYFKNSLFTR